MALLLAMYQKMKLVREKNQLQCDQIKYSRNLKRVEKNIANQTKRYESLFAQLDAQAKQMQSQAQIFFQNIAGIGAGNYSNLNPNGFTGMNGFVCSAMAGYLSKGVPISKDSTITIDQNKYNIMMNHYMTNSGFRPKVDDKGNTIYLDEAKQKPDYGADFTVDDVNAFLMAMRQAQNDQSNAQMWANNLNTQYGQNVSIWVEAKKAELEAEQDSVIEPLKYQQTMWELDNDYAEQRLKRIDSELEGLKQLTSKEAQDSAPKFGLG